MSSRPIQWYAGHVYRTLHRIAARDPALRLAVGVNGRLEAYAGETRVIWFALDSRGEPYAFGAHDDDVGSICGPWSFEQDGIRHPIWVARPADAGGDQGVDRPASGRRTRPASDAHE